MGVALYFRGLEIVFKGYIDSDFASDLDKMRSIIDYVFTLAREAIS